MKPQPPRSRLRPASPLSAQGKAIGGGLALLVSIYVAANKELTGGRLLVALVISAGAIALIVEAFYRFRDNRHWHLPGAFGASFALVALLLALLPSPHNAEADEGNLRLSLDPTPPELFHLAFSQKINLPSAGEGWSELRREGGIDVGDSHFRMLLVNETSSPITVFNVKAEVLGSEEMPHGSTAWAYSQGDEGLDHLVSVLPDGHPGSVSRIYPSSAPHETREQLEQEVPFFQSKYVSLEPGEVFPTSLTIESETPRTIEYRLLAEGESANRHFVVRSKPQKIVGNFEDPYQQDFARYYQYGHDVHDCTPTPDNPWVDARNSHRSLACPYGLGHPYEAVPVSESDYPPGELNLSVQLAPGKQSASISEVEVGAAPAAAPVPEVVKPLLDALGAWTKCSIFSPTTSYWTATWEAWELSVVFTADGGPTDCTPRSRASVREIDLRGQGETVGTNLGPLELGSSGLQVPAAIRQLAERTEPYEGEAEFVVPGYSPCDPRTVDETRYQLLGEGGGGILNWEEVPPSVQVSGASVLLPDPAMC